jgi:hypothetical protein
VKIFGNPDNILIPKRWFRAKRPGASRCPLQIRQAGNKRNIFDAKNTPPGRFAKTQTAGAQYLKRRLGTVRRKIFEGTQLSTTLYRIPSTHRFCDRSTNRTKHAVCNPFHKSRFP